MRRFSSIDFLRGLAIVLMLVLHIISDTLDVDALTSDIGALGLIQILALFILPFMGGLAGFFLMVSAMGNSVSMTRFLEKGGDWKDLIIRQVMGGVLLLVFAFLVEGLIGYKGTWGNLFDHLDNLAGWNTGLWRYRGFHFETIHTIAWCIIINGIIHGLLARNGGWKNVNQMFKKYIIIAVIVVAVTPLVWMIGNPYIDSLGHPGNQNYLFYPVLGESNILELIRGVFIGPLAGMPEPLFPYLATSCIGTMIGIWMAQDKEKVDRSKLHKFARIGFLMFVVGLIGLVVNLIFMFDSLGIDDTLSFYQLIWDHRRWVPYNGVPYLGWLFQYLALNGFAICAIISIVRVVEFRGKGKEFAEKTTFIRRFGFVAFSVYSNQYIFFMVHGLVGLFFGGAYAKLPWGGTFLVLGLSFLAFYAILRLWEKVGYIGSLEWCIGTLAAIIIPARRRAIKKSEGSVRWWLYGKLDVENAFYNAEWLDIIEKDQVQHKALVESRLSSKLAFWGFLFPPFSFIAYNAAKASVETEGENKYNKRGKIVGLIGIIFFITWVILFNIISLNTLGLGGLL